MLKVRKIWKQIITIPAKGVISEAVLEKQGINSTCGTEDTEKFHKGDDIFSLVLKGD